MARLGVLNKSGRVSQLKGKDLDAFMQEREFQATHGLYFFKTVGFGREMTHL
jgi:hypothetical protein